MSKYEARWQTVKVDVENGIGWITLNRPEKRNAMSPTLNREMIDVLETLELDDDAQVIVLTGAGDAFAAALVLSLHSGGGDLALACRRGLQLSAMTVECRQTVCPQLAPDTFGALISA